MNNMRKLAVAAGAMLLALSSLAMVPQFGLNAIGDFSLVTLGKYTFSTPVVVDLAPTNAPTTNVTCAVRCQVIYVDGDVQTPTNELELEKLRQTGDWLTGLLKDFIADNYRGAEYEDLVRRYYEGAIGVDLDRQFPAFVRAHMGEADLDIEIVKVQIFAEGDLRRALIEVLKE